MARATPSPSPNPNALRFQLDTTLPDTLSWNSAAEAAGNPFGEAVFALDGVVSIFGVNDFVTVTRSAGAAWDPIVEGVQAAAAEHL
ncbi:MAG: NifU N-terminal domain-containing protein [Acidimicrobiales bacterium]